MVYLIAKTTIPYSMIRDVKHWNSTIQDENTNYRSFYVLGFPLLNASIMSMSNFEIGTGCFLRFSTSLSIFIFLIAFLWWWRNGLAWCFFLRGFDASIMWTRLASVGLSPEPAPDPDPEPELSSIWLRRANKRWWCNNRLKWAAMFLSAFICSDNVGRCFGLWCLSRDLWLSDFLPCPWCFADFACSFAWFLLFFFFASVGFSVVVVDEVGVVVDACVVVWL